MNKIEVKNNSIITKLVDDSITVITNELLVFNIKIIFNKPTDLEIYFDSDTDTKLNIEYILDKNIVVNLYEMRTGLKTKVQYQYTLNSDAFLYLYRFNNSQNMREVDIMNLKGENASLEFNLRTLSTNKEKYDIYIYHDQKKTRSVLNSIGIALKGSIIFNVTGVVEKGNSGSFLEQNNQIVTLTSEKCQINPNLLIVEYEVDASHNATIGKFNSEEIFYLMSRGIKEEDAIKLLGKGLILSSLKDETKKDTIINYIDEYWR